jgi:hypothetical protein
MPRTEPTRQKTRTTKASKSTSLDHHFGSLKLHDTLDEHQESIEPSSDVKRLPSVPDVIIGADEFGIEEDFFFHIKAFLKELRQIRT